MQEKIPFFSRFAFKTRAFETMKFRNFSMNFLSYKLNLTMFVQFFMVK